LELESGLGSAEIKSFYLCLFENGDQCRFAAKKGAHVVLVLTGSGRFAMQHKRRSAVPYLEFLQSLRFIDYACAGLSASSAVSAAGISTRRRKLLPRPDQCSITISLNQQKLQTCIQRHVSSGLLPQIFFSYIAMKE
jgi:hypothetical protein